MDPHTETDRLTTQSADPEIEEVGKIRDKAQQLNSTGLTANDERVLKERLRLCWSEPEEISDKIPPTTKWRKSRTREVYAAIQDASNHLFLPAILVITPTDCIRKSFNTILNHLTHPDSYEPYHLELNAKIKKFFESTAAEEGFTCSHGYLNFMEVIFPKSTQGELTAVPEISSSDSNLTTTQEHRVSENASLQGIVKVFNKHMGDAIRRVTVDGDLKAAVTMVFPPWAVAVDCLMSLDVCEQDVEQLAMDLFNAKVKWVEQSLHVTLKEGTTLVIPNSEEATLKGAPDAAVFKVFGPEIYDAMTQCPIRRTELAEGKHVTECVSMIFIKNGAFINLSLDLEGGLQIWNKLHA